MDKVTMLGTGHAMTTKCFNTCFVYENEVGKMLVDTGGGQQLVGQLRKAGVQANDIDCLFMTHRHTDHLLGLPWLMRMRMRHLAEKPLEIIAHSELCCVARELLHMLFPESEKELEQGLVFHEVTDGETVEACGRRMLCYDTRNERCRQFGFSMTLGNGKKFVYNGDVPYDERNYIHMANADYLMHEAFCLEKNWNNKGHTCAALTAKYAAQLKAKTLIIVHCDDVDYENRRESYTQEAANHFEGPIFVPYDLETVDLS